MGVGSAIPTRPGDETDGTSGFDPALGCKDKAVEAGLFSNPIEFDGIEIRIIQLFPNAEKFDRIAVAQPVLDDVVRSRAVLVARNIGNANVVSPFCDTTAMVVPFTSRLTFLAGSDLLFIHQVGLTDHWPSDSKSS